MDDATLQALKDSIAKWEKNARAECLDNVRMGMLHCPLCKIFNGRGHRGNDCEGCPVREHTGVQYCYETPYWDADKANDYFQFERFLSAARAEVDFLKSLLPEAQS